MSDIKLTPEEIETMLDNAARRGAKEALRSIGLLDDDAATAVIDTKGAIADNLSSLTPGQSYFVQLDGTLGTTAADPSVLAGTAISATEIIVKT
jgi:hypothetical protein